MPAIVVVCASLCLSATAQHSGFAGHFSGPSHFGGAPGGFAHGVPGHGAAVSLSPFRHFPGTGLFPFYPWMYVDDGQPYAVPTAPEVIVVRDGSGESRAPAVAVAPAQAKMIEVPGSGQAKEQNAGEAPATLVLRDGTEMTVRRYTIMGHYLYDASRPQHTSRIALDQLDLEATQRVNAQNGVVFSIPSDSNEVVVRF